MGVTVLGIQHHFYPRSPCGERLLTNRRNKNLLLFLSTLSLRRATSIIELIEYGFVFLSTLSLRRATNPKIRLSLTIMISIHALLAESDRVS